MSEDEKKAMRAKIAAAKKEYRHRQKGIKKYS